MLCLHCNTPVQKEFYIIQLGLYQNKNSRRILSRQGLFLCDVMTTVPNNELLSSYPENEFYYRIRSGICKTYPDNSIDYTKKPEITDYTRYLTQEVADKHRLPLNIQLFSPENLERSITIEMLPGETPFVQKNFRKYLDSPGAIKLFDKIAEQTLTLSTKPF